MPVEILLWALFATGLAPVQMSFEGWNYDVFSGLFALPVAALAFDGMTTRRRGLALGYHIVGLLLLLNILVIAVLSMPTPIRQFHNEPANTIVAHFPVIWLPAVLVPFALMGHVLGIRQLLRR